MRAIAPFTAVVIGLLSTLPGHAAIGADAADSLHLELERRFAGEVRPFLESYCIQCHGKEKQRGKLDLSAYSTVASVLADYRRWETVREKLEADEMPPGDATRHPAQELRRGVIEWIRTLRKHEADRSAGDPGPVLARRLSNAEYDYTVRDLTGVDLQPAREFPVDPANEAGFDNSGESLAMSPALLKKYLEAARGVAEHVVLKPKGFTFAPHPVVTETDRDKYCVKRIVDFYRRQPTDYAAYFMTAWRFKSRAALGHPEATLADLCARDGLSSRYLTTIWATLTGSQEDIGPLAQLQAMWRELPASARDEGAALRECERMRDFIVRLRPKLRPEFQNLGVPGIAQGSQPFVLWKDRQYAATRTHCDFGALDRQGESKSPTESKAPAAAAPGAAADAAVVLPAGEAARKRLEASLVRFCAVFPDAFYLPERGLIFLKDDTESEGRLLSAGFHLMVGYFRDDAPLCELILDDAGRRELDLLWDELRFITLAPQRQYKDYIFFERAEPPRFMQGAEFDFARSEDKDVTSETKIRRLAGLYLAKARRKGGEGAAIGAIEDYFRDISAEIRWLEATRAAAEPTHLDALLELARRAYRRPLSQAERDDLLGFYRSLREKDGLSHEEAIRDALSSVLVSPHFCYRIQLTQAGEAVGSDAAHRPKGSLVTAPLSAFELASRLSYFLWCSMPDEELLERAEAGDLLHPEVLAAQARRLLKDDRMRGFATEFAGNWLDFRRFEAHNGVDRERFKSFTNELRQAMFEEPIRFFMDVVREDRSVLDLLHASDTFVNPVLARHYGMPDNGLRADEWARVDDAGEYGRGGLLPMAVFLTMNAPGLRTSPVKRGYWVVRRLLGEVIPPPPPTVPELPGDEAKLGDLTLREALARHREDRSCAGCHVRFDSIGLAFEGYGPVGELRAQDFGGRTVDTRATFPGGGEGAGLNGLRFYLHERREKEFVDNLCRKLLAYALGRSLIIPDDATIDRMRSKLTASGHRMGALVETIITSPQFLRKRGPEDSTRGE